MRDTVLSCGCWLLAAAPLAAQEPPPWRGAVSLAFEASDAPLAALEGDVLLLPVFEGEAMSALVPGADPALAAALEAASAQAAFGGRLDQTLSVWAPAGLRAKRLLLVGAGAEAELDAARLRRLSGVGVRAIWSQRVFRLQLHVRGALAPEPAAAAVAEGALIALFDPGLHKSEPRRALLETLSVSGLGSGAELQRGFERGAARAEAVNLARSLAMEPANHLTPEGLAAQARRIADAGGLELTLFDERQLAEQGFGGVLAVGKGSAHPPRLIALRYRAAASGGRTLALLGKGVCFDSGGISLKGRDGMYRMKGDMAGGAAVLAAMQLVARFRPAVDVLGVVPAVENMPGPSAQKPGDVFVGLSGQTVEVLSTDAEGRLILSDAITWSIRQGATHLVDVATLTGSVRGALGDRHVGAFSNDEALWQALQAAAARSGESFWRLPIDDEYAGQIRKSLVADLNETGGLAGASVGAVFLQQFVEGRPWIHLDIAGTSWPDEAAPWRAAGPTGVAVLTLAELALGMQP